MSRALQSSELSEPTSSDDDVAPRRHRTFDLRAMVVLWTLIVMLAGSLAFLALLLPARQSSDMLRRVIDELEPPRDHLLAAERASANGLASLDAAVRATGDERTERLSDALSYSELIATEWQKFEASAAGLPGERRLTDRFRAHQALSVDVTSAALVPILNSGTTGSIPVGATEASDRLRQDLIGLHSTYRRASRVALDELRGNTRRFELMVVSGGIGAAVLVMSAAVIGMRKARRTVVERAARSEAARLGEFETRLHRALEFVDNDAAAFAVADRALHGILPEATASLLISDSSRSRLIPVNSEPSCGVVSPGDCPAMRAGSALTFSDSTQLDACPLLGAHAAEPCSATCVPITVAGRGAALMHLVGPVDDPPDRHGVTELVARGVGERVTLLQAFATFQLQAERDPLTGLLNRRSLETAVAKVVDSGVPYAVAFGDLDHFKRLNDLHGHDAGDRALRTFSRVLRESLRPQDICCRWGGEEFVIVMPTCDAAVAQDVMDRVRTNLALGSIAAQTYSVTASFGVTSSTDADSFDEAVEHADQALRQAKDTGRNRTVAYDPLGLVAAIAAADEPV